MSEPYESEIFSPTSRWNPIREMEHMMRGINKAIGGMSARSHETMALADWSPSVDIGETEHEFVVEVDLPDVKKEDIKVNVQESMLCISGERKIEVDEKTIKYHRVERSYGRFERSFGLPDEADAEKITSEFKDGILTVHLPKAEVIKPTVHEIPIQ